MALVFPTPAQAALQTPVNTFSPSSTPLVNTSNGNTYTYIPAKGVWVLGTSGGVVVSVGVVSPLTSTGGTNPIISIDPASTVASGAVQLNDTTNSPSTTQAATARAVCAAANLAGAAIPCACLLAKGDILGATAASTPTALPVGADGLVLTACSAAATGLCWAAAGGGGGGVTAVTGTAPISVTAGATPDVSISAATDTASGAVELATSAETQTGTDTTRAVTPAGAAATYIGLACLTGKGAILGASAASTPLALAVGTDGQILSADSTAATGLKWINNTGDATPILAGKVFGYTGAAANCNVSLGYCALGAAGTLGFCNVAVGLDALQKTSGSSNTAVGYRSLFCSTSGSSLTAVGACTLASNTTGSDNVAMGRWALRNNTSGLQNVGLGGDALAINTTGSLNTGVGYSALLNNTTGQGNTGVGNCSLYSNTTGSCNTTLGFCALQNKVTGNQNTVVGAQAMGGIGCAAADSARNTALGALALNWGDLACDNIAVGVGSLCRLVCGYCNIAIGCEAGICYVGESGNVIIGRWSGNNTDCNTISLADGTGNLRLKFNCDGALSFDGLAYGNAGEVLQSNGVGAKPTWVPAAGGGGTVTSITAGTGLTGGTITSSGTIALADTAVTCGSYTYASITVDCQGRLTAASSGTAPVTSVSGTAPISSTGGATPVISISEASNIACGAIRTANNAETLAGIATNLAVNPSGAKATYIGKSLVFKGALITACVAGDPVALSPGSDGQVLVANSFTNTGLEWQNKYAAPNTHGFVLGCTDATNAALGCAAIYQLTSGTGNSALGCGSGSGITTGSNNVAVGFLAGCAITTGSNNVAIGCNAQVASATASCQLAIGFSATDNWLTGNSTKAVKLEAGLIDCANVCGTAGQVLFSTGANSFCWGNAPGATAATPTVLGTVYGKQCSSANGLTAYGYCSGGTTTGTCNTVIGWCSLMGATGNANIAIGANSQIAATSDNNISIGNSTLQGASGNCNVAIGNSSMSAVSTGSVNTAVGTISLNSLTRGVANAAFGWNALRNAGTGAGLSNIDENTAFGASALCGVTTGCRNTAVGAYAGCAITTGSANVVIGPCVQVASATGSCQLAIGYSATANWLTGNGSKAIQPGAGIIDCAVSCGTADMVLTSQGNAIQWKSVASTIAVPNYGSFLSTVSQSNLDTTNGNKVTYNTTTESRNVSVVDGSKLTVAVAGTYNIQMSMQVTKTDAGTDDMTFWFKKNGVNVDNSATNLTLEGNNNAQLASLNFVITLAAGDYIEIWWYSLDTNILLLAEPAAAPAPAIPSIIATVVPVGA